MATKKSFFTVLLVAIILCGLGLIAGAHQAKAVSKTIIVPNDYLDKGRLEKEGMQWYSIIA